MQFIRDYINYRELIWNMVKTNLKLRYRSSALGFVWSLLEPLAISIVLIFVFSHVLSMRIPNYPTYLITGIMTWRFFTLTSGTMRSIISNARLVKKIYFPRHVLVFSSCLFSLVVTVFEFIVLFGIVLAFGTSMSIYVLMLPVLLFTLFLFILGTSLALSAIYVYYRDLEHIWSVVLRAGFYASPIIFRGELLPPEYMWIFHINPMSHFIIAIREVLLYSHFPAQGTIIGMTGFTIAALLLGYFIFGKLEWKFAEEV